RSSDFVPPPSPLAPPPGERVNPDPPLAFASSPRCSPRLRVSASRPSLQAATHPDPGFPIPFHDGRAGPPAAGFGSGSSALLIPVAAPPPPRSPPPASRYPPRTTATPPPRDCDPAQFRPPRSLPVPPDPRSSAVRNLLTALLCPPSPARFPAFPYPAR